jgi:hypothetical protein
MIRRLPIYAIILGTAALIQFRPFDFLKSRGERYFEASRAAEREIDAFNRLHFEKAAIQRGERLESKMAAQFYGARIAKALAAEATSLGVCCIWQCRTVLADARIAEAQELIDRQVVAIDVQIAAQWIRTNEAARVQKSLAPDK